jgi:glycine hydroxymethyltransferase
MIQTTEKPVSQVDKAISDAWGRERQRQEEHIELIASENYTSPAVLRLQGSVLTNKYAEGYPHKRYYGGCEFVDEIEVLAIERAKKLFGADYANVQPHSGSQANQAVYQALLSPGDTLLAMDLNSGGHLTHGCPVNFSGKLYNCLAYGLDENGVIDYAAAEALAKEHKPKLVVAGFSAYSGIVDWQRFRDIADSVGAYLMVDMAHVAGLVAAGLYPSPVQIADVVTSTTHKTLRGPRSGIILAKSNPDLEKKINSSVFPGLQGGPLMHVIGAKAVAFNEAMQPEFKQYQQQVLNNALRLVDTLKQRGFRIVSDGTQNHMFLIDFSGSELTGKVAEAALGLANITVNKNSVPGDTRSPFVTSGLRIGTPAVTTRGFQEAEMELLGNWIADILDNVDDKAAQERVKASVLKLCAGFPVYSADVL